MSGEDRIRTVAEKAGEVSQFHSGGAESGAVGAETVPVDPDLQAVIERWPDLPDVVKVDIVAMVRAAKSKASE